MPSTDRRLRSTDPLSAFATAITLANRDAVAEWIAGPFVGLILPNRMLTAHPETETILRDLWADVAGEEATGAFSVGVDWFSGPLCPKPLRRPSMELWRAS
jgi:hypothetical protein